jgi:hypothetical protein
MPIFPSGTAASFEALRQSRWLRTADGFAVFGGAVLIRDQQEKHNDERHDKAD